MKISKNLFGIILLLFLCTPAKADVTPLYTGIISNSVIGFLQVPPSFNVRLYPREDSQILETIKYTNTSIKYKNEIAEPYRLYAVQVVNQNLAFCTVTDTKEEWYKIIYDKNGNKSGWIKPQKEEDFWSLKDFYSYFGRRYGLYYMKNIDYQQRGLYSGAHIMSQKLGGFTMIRSIRLNKLSGNWALVTVTDLDRIPKIGYIQWRESDGTLIIFPKFNQ